MITDLGAPVDLRLVSALACTDSQLADGFGVVGKALTSVVASGVDR